MRYEYTTIGHVTADLMAGGERRPGGGAFYSALQAARLGLRTLVVTQGVRAEVEALLEPFAAEFELHVIAAPRTTVLETSGPATERLQRVLSWAGEITDPPPLDTDLLHLAPVARECPLRWRGGARFVALTPQGLVREWGRGGLITLAPARPHFLALARHCRAVVVNERERPYCEQLLARACAAGAAVAITAEGAPNLLLSGDRRLSIPVPALGRVADDVGAGDVYAAAFFTALAAGADLGAAARLGNGAAAVRMGRVGTDAVGTRAQIEARCAASV